ncbi:hypothetical protein JCM9803A_02100 [Rhodococcus erythropolis]
MPTQNGFDGAWRMFDADRAPYDRPPLSKEFLAGTAIEADVSLVADSWFTDQNIDLIGY